MRSSRRRDERAARQCRRTSVDSGVPLTFLHETVLGGAGELLALCAHRLRRTCFPFAFFQKAGERSASQRLAILTNRFACASLFRHCGADRQGRDDGSEEDSLHGLPPIEVSLPSITEIALSTNCHSLADGSRFEDPIR